MRVAFLIFALITASPAEAACKKYSVWRYPYPQRCELKPAPKPAPKPIKVDAPAPEVQPVALPPIQPTEAELRAQAIEKLKVLMK